MLASAADFVEVNGIIGIREHLKRVVQIVPNGIQAMASWRGSDLTGSPQVKWSY